MRTLNDVYNSNEDSNNHIENARIVVEAFGTAKELEIIEKVIKRKNSNIGYTPALYNTIIQTGLKYEDKRISEGDNIFFYNGVILK